MTVEQAIARLQAQADKLRAEDNWAVAHEWQRRADEMAHLARIAAQLPVARKKAPK